MLMHPFLDRPYDPQISHFLGGFEIYDCEETLGEELSQFDLNSAEDRKELIYKYVVHRFRDLSYRHKFLFFVCSQLHSTIRSMILVRCSSTKWFHIQPFRQDGMKWRISEFSLRISINI